MNRADEDWRNAVANALTKVVTDALTKAGIDSRTLTIGAVDGTLLIGGTVPDEPTRTKLQAILATGRFGPAIRCEVGVAQAQTIDSQDGRGRSVCGTESPQESRHPLDRD